MKKYTYLVKKIIVCRDFFESSAKGTINKGVWPKNNFDFVMYLTVNKFNISTRNFESKSVIV